MFVFSAQGSDERKENYNKRKDFFTKYSYAIPANERLKWKNSAPVYTGSNVAQTAGWKCPKCSTVNANSSNYCVSCGTKKP